MKTIREETIRDTVAALCVEANLRLPPDVCAALERAKKVEDGEIAGEVLALLQKNERIAAERGLPICQDTGAACIFAEVGTDLHIEGDFEAAVTDGVRKGYAEGYLRKSMVSDPLRLHGGNTGDNTPGFLTVRLVPGDTLRLTVMPKGFGSENMSRLAMLKPSNGAEGVKKFILETVELAGSNACPPMILGVGIGGCFDRVALLAKEALLRPLDIPNPDPAYAALEKELLEEINRMGIGPQGFGGKTTCLGVAVEWMPTHVAGLPVAVNVSCHVTRRATMIL